jgi:hypothetical protein
METGLLTFVPHARAITVAATTDTSLAFFDFGSNSRAMISVGGSAIALKLASRRSLRWCEGDKDVPTWP